MTLLFSSEDYESALGGGKTVLPLPSGVGAQEAMLLFSLGAEVLQSGGLIVKSDTDCVTPDKLLNFSVLFPHLELRIIRLMSVLLCRLCDMP